MGHSVDDQEITITVEMPHQESEENTIGAGSKLPPVSMDESAPASEEETGAAPDTAPDAPTPGDKIGAALAEEDAEAIIETSAALPEDTEAKVEAEEPSAGEGEEEAPERQWYVVHGYSGYENRVKKNLEQRIESMGMQDSIFQVVVPTEEEIEIRGGERRIIERRVFPGYILVQMVMDETSWYVVRNTPGVTGFVGTGNKPTPLSAEEVEKIMKRIESAEPTIKVSFKVGQKVRLTEGSFADFVGEVDDLYPEKGRARVLISMFGRDTPLEVDLLHLERV